MAVTDGVFVPDFYYLRVSRQDEVHLLVEVESFDWQVVKVVFDQQWLAGAQIIQEHL